MNRLGLYDVLGKLGEGGMGVVYRARHRQSQTLAAVKLLHPDQQGNLHVRKRFLHEARMGSLVQHPNVVRVLEFGEVHLEGAQRTLYLALELVTGRDLLQRLSVEEPPVAEVVGIGLQVVDALEAIHRQGIVHRDIKPGNVLIGTDGVAKLLDFGLAKPIGEPEEPLVPEEGNLKMLVDLEMLSTETGSVVGTAGYAAPEQLRGAPASERADFFGLGVLLYQALSGRLPFRGDHLAELLHSMKGEVADLRELRPDVPEALDELVRELLAYDPEQRPARLEEIRERLLQSRAALGDDENGAASADAEDDRTPRSWWSRLRGFGSES